MKKVFITGLEGFVGGHLGNLLIEGDYKIGGTIFGKENDFILNHRTKLFIKKCDITNKFEVAAVLEEFRPDVLLHLAAISYVPFSWENPIDTLKTNLIGTQTLLEAVKTASAGTRVIYISSANVYGKSDGGYPLTEDSPKTPDNPYALSKLMGEDICRFYTEKFDLDIIILRPFNHIGPGQPPDFALSSFAQQIALIEKGKQYPEMFVGDLKPARDFTDVRDVVKAYKRLIDVDLDHDVFNICSGNTVVIEDALNKLLSLSTSDIKVSIDKERYRPSDIPIYYGSNDRIKKTIGWEPEISFEQSLEDILNFWREKL